MAIYFMGVYLVTLVLVLSLICVQNQVASEEVLEDSLLGQPYGSDKIADIINQRSSSNRCNGRKEYHNFTAPGRRVSEIKCLEYIWDIMQEEHRTLWGHYCDSRIVGGGRAALYGEIAHMGAVGWRSSRKGRDMWVYKCGASLISHKFLITAAHCSQLPKRDRSVRTHVPEVVKLGDKFIINEVPLFYDDYNEYESSTKFWDMDIFQKIYNRISKGSLHIPSEVIKIERIVKHPEYASPRHYYDIALIELQKPVTFGTLIRPACLWNNNDTSSLEDITVSGWGEVNPATKFMSDELQVGDVGIINDFYCDTLLMKNHNRNWHGLLDHQLCAGDLSGSVDTCRGDSGGPLQAKINISLQGPFYHLIGVTSFSYGCMRTEVPGVYVRVASFIDWIESVVWPET